MNTLGGLQAQLLRMHQQGNWWQLVLLYVLLFVLWYCLRRCRHSADIKLPVQVAELWVYPVKSCAGIQLTQVTVERGGMQWDRQFAIVKPDGEVLSQKTHPELAKICPSFSFAREGCVLPWGEPLPVRKGQEDKWERVHDLPPGTSPTSITLSVGESSVQVRLTPDASTKKVSTVWGGNSTPLDADRYPDADTWLQEQLGFECSICRLVSRRQLRTTRLAPVSNDENDCCRYQDGAPLTVLSQESVAELNRNLPRSSQKVRACRFRPNIIVSGCQPFEECTWGRVMIQQSPMVQKAIAKLQPELAGKEQESSKPVSIRMLMDAYRCTMVTIAQAAEGGGSSYVGSGAPDPKAHTPGTRPDGHKLLANMKKLLHGDPSWYGPLPRDAPNFAVFAALDQDIGTIHVGDNVTVDTVAVGARSQGNDSEERGHYPTIWAYNRAGSGEEFRLDENRFWHSTGQKAVSQRRSSTGDSSKKTQ